MTDGPAETNRALKQFLMEHVYSIPPLVAERQIACDGIAKLFALFLEHPDQLPEAHRDRVDMLPLHRVVCDYIAGMTDGFFRRTANRLLP